MQTTDDLPDGGPRRPFVALGRNKLDGGTLKLLPTLRAVNGTFVPGGAHGILGDPNNVRPGRKWWWPAAPQTARPARGARRFWRESFPARRGDRGKPAPTDPPRSAPLPKSLFRFCTAATPGATDS